MDFLYNNKCEILANKLSNVYKPPSVMEHGKEYLIAKIPRESEDGYDVELYETRYPASFFRIVAKRGLIEAELTTGSGMSEYVATTITNLVQGMLEVKARLTKDLPPV